jgi:hypothetical protein
LVADRGTTIGSDSEGSRNQFEIATAAREIDARLIADHIGAGESRYEAVRIGFCRPLGVEYEVFDDVRTLIVHGVWRVNQSKRK